MSFTGPTSTVGKKKNFSADTVNFKVNCKARNYSSGLDKHQSDQLKLIMVSQ